MSSSPLQPNEAIFLGTVLEGYFYGVYCIIFVLCMNITKKKSNRLRYPLITLFTLCSIYMCTDFTSQFITIFRPTGERATVATFAITVFEDAMFAIIDVISQSILIYRCWVMWNQNPLFIVFPSILAGTSFTLSIVLTIKQLLLGPTGAPPAWWFKVALASFSISLSVNFLVTAILVFKILMLHRELTSSGTHMPGTYKLKPLISIIIESGMFTFVAEVLWVTFVRLQSDGNPGFGAIVAPTTMIYGITPTIVLVRAASGRSYDSTFVDSRIELPDRGRHAASSATAITFGQSQKSVNITHSVQSRSDYEADNLKSTGAL